MASTSASAPLVHVRGALRAVACAVIPSAAGLDAAGWERFDAIVERAVSERPRSVQRQVVLFLRALSALSLLRFARPLARLDGARCRILLGFLERSRVLALRRGVWGVRTLAFMGYYAQPSVQDELGYRAVPAGWGARGRADA
jgi:hypothetical protein